MKKIVAAALVLMMLLALAVPAAAEGSIPFLNGNYQTDAEHVLLPGITVAETAAISCSANGTPVSGVQRTTVGDANVPITYVCITDPSIDLTMNQREQQLEALRALCASKRAIDKIIMVTVADALDGWVQISTDAELEAAITANLNLRYVTYINECMIQFTEQIKTAEGLEGSICVVLMSNAVDDISSPDRENAAMAAVAASGLNINTVTLMDPYPSDYTKSKAEYLSHFASSSVGGIHTAPILDEITATEAVQKIMTAALGATVVQLDGSELDHSGADVLIEAVCQVDGLSYTGSATIPASVVAAFPEPVVIEETMPELSLTEDPLSYSNTDATAADASGSEGSGAQSVVNSMLSAIDMDNYIMLGGIAVAFVVLAIVITILVIRRGHADDGDDVEFMEQYDEYIPVNNAPLLADIVIPQEEKNDAPRPVSPAEEAAAARGCKVRLYAQPQNEVALQMVLPLNTGKTIGRTQRSDYILNGTDTALSGLHFELMWDGNAMNIKDRTSTNGTYIEREPIKPETWVAVKYGTVISVGANEYKLKFKPIQEKKAPEQTEA